MFSLASVSTLFHFACFFTRFFLFLIAFTQSSIRLIIKTDRNLTRKPHFRGNNVIAFFFFLFQYDFGHLEVPLPHPLIRSLCFVLLRRILGFQAQFSSYKLWHISLPILEALPAGSFPFSSRFSWLFSGAHCSTSCVTIFVACFWAPLSFYQLGVWLYCL